MTPANICCNSNKVNLAHVLVQFALAHVAAIKKKNLNFLMIVLFLLTQIETRTHGDMFSL